MHHERIVKYYGSQVLKDGNIFILVTVYSLENNATIKCFYAMGINYFYGHFEGANKGYFMPCDNNLKNQKLIYSTELRLKTLKNSFLCGNFDWI